MRSCRVTILACFRFLSKDTMGRQACLCPLGPTCPSYPLLLRPASGVPTPAMALGPQAATRAQARNPSSQEPQDYRTLGCCTLSDGSAGRAFFMFQPDLLQGHEVLCQFAAPFEDCGIGSLGTRTRAAQPHSGPALLCPTSSSLCLCLGRDFGRTALPYPPTPSLKFCFFQSPLLCEAVPNSFLVRRNCLSCKPPAGKVSLYYNTSFVLPYVLLMFTCRSVLGSWKERATSSSSL